MNYLPFAVFAYLLNAVAVTIDKLLLTKTIPNPLTYIFYISLLSLLALFAVPFTKIPGAEVFILASASTVLWTLGAYFMFWGLKIGQVTRVIPVIGTLTPLFLLLFAYKSLSSTEGWAAAILILGLVFITSQSWIGKINKQEILFEILASFLFAASYIFLKEAFLQADLPAARLPDGQGRQGFLTVLVWSRWILIPFVIITAFLHHHSKITLNKLFLVGQTAGATSQLLLTFSISLASPVLVNSLQGTQFVFLFIFGLIFFKEKSSKLFLFIKILGIILISLGLYILAVAQR